VLALAVSAYLLNFFWESLHAVNLYQNLDIAASNYLPLMLYVSTVDSLLIFVMYLTVSLIWRDIFWLRKVNTKQLLTFAGTGIIIAAIIEYHALFVAHKWSYSTAMPTLFGIGLSPLLQLAVTGILALYIARKF